MSFRFLGIDHVQLAAPKDCEAKARHFYSSILGLEEIEKPENLKKRGGVWFRCGKHQIHIGVWNAFVPAAKAHPAFEVDDVQALKDHLARAGVPAEDDQPLPGAKRFYVKDPFGNRLEFLEWTDR